MASSVVPRSLGAAPSRSVALELRLVDPDHRRDLLPRSGLRVQLLEPGGIRARRQVWAAFASRARTRLTVTGRTLKATVSAASAGSRTVSAALIATPSRRGRSRTAGRPPASRGPALPAPAPNETRPRQTSSDDSGLQGCPWGCGSSRLVRRPDSWAPDTGSWGHWQRRRRLDSRSRRPSPTVDRGAVLP